MEGPRDPEPPDIAPVDLRKNGMPHASRVVAVSRPVRFRSDLTAPTGRKAEQNQNERTATSQAPPCLKPHEVSIRAMAMVSQQSWGERDCSRDERIGRAHFGRGPALTGRPQPTRSEASPLCRLGRFSVSSVPRDSLAANRGRSRNGRPKRKVRLVRIAVNTCSR
jgi:hypothetical protein